MSGRSLFIQTKLYVKQKLARSMEKLFNNLSKLLVDRQVGNNGDFFGL